MQCRALLLHFLHRPLRVPHSAAVPGLQEAAPSGNMTPSEVVAMLDKHIVGQVGLEGMLMNVLQFSQTCIQMRN
jgi:hypothetical protein